MNTLMHLMRLNQSAKCRQSWFAHALFRLDGCGLVKAAGTRGDISSSSVWLIRISAVRKQRGVPGQKNAAKSSFTYREGWWSLQLCLG
jgi:hypothetical protein